MLTRAYKMILNNRTAWNVQRLFWYHWRDPQHPAASCSFCGSAGLFSFDRTPKPAYAAFTSFTAETTKPTATITGGPAPGQLTKDPTPTFTFTSNEPGSTFVCRVDGGSLQGLQLAVTRSPTCPTARMCFFVRAIDARRKREPAGRVATSPSTPSPPATPTITATEPASPANDNAPEGDRHRGSRHDREDLQDGGLHRHSGRPRSGAPVQLARDHRLGPRQLDHLVARQGDRRRRQRSRLLGRVAIRRGLDAVGSGRASARQSNSMIGSKPHGSGGNGRQHGTAPSGRAHGGRSGRPTVRLAIALAALGFALFAPSTAGAVRSEFYGIVQGQPFDDTDVQGLQNARVHTIRYLFSWEWVQPRTKNNFNWGTQDKFIGRLANRGSGSSRPSGGTRAGSPAYTARPPLDRPQDTQAWQAFLKAVGEPLRTGRQLLARARSAPGTRTPRRFRSSRTRSGTSRT